MGRGLSAADESPRRILAIGGHEFTRAPGNEAICDLLVRLAGGAPPRICLLPTASGDPQDQIASFRRLLAERDCAPSEISLFRLGSRPVDLRAHLLSQDAIYVGGGSLVNLIAIWRAHGLDSILREAWERGVLLCGQSAGAMCWFERGITRSRGEPMVAPGLGLLPGSACVHYDSEPERRSTYLEAVAGGLEPGFGLDDRAAVLFVDRELAGAYSALVGAAVRRVHPRGSGAVETTLPHRRLQDATLPTRDTDPAVVEYREQRRRSSGLRASS